MSQNQYPGDRRGDVAMANGAGTAIHMTAGVHCCDCWKFSDRLEVTEQAIRSAVDIVQTTGLKGSPSYAAAERLLVTAFDQADFAVEVPDVE